LSRDCLTRYVPPSGFGYPLGGLRPSVPCRLFFTPAALLGFTLRSFLLQKGTRAITARMSPLTVSPASDPDAGALGRPSRPRFLGFNPSRSPWRMLPWVWPFQGSLAKALAEPSPGLLSRASQTRRSLALPAGAPESRSALPGSFLLPRRWRWFGRGDPLRVLAPAQSQALRLGVSWAMRSPHIVSCITADQPMILGRTPRPPELPGPA